MKRKERYMIGAVCALLLSSCLGDSGSKITVGTQEAVYQTHPSRGLVLRDGRLIYSSSINSLRANEGDCFLVEYAFDSADPELQRSDSLSVELLGTPTEVSVWPSRPVPYTDALLSDEQPVASVGRRMACIKGRLFLWLDQQQPASQVDSFFVTYDPAQPSTTVEGVRTYTLYLRSVRQSVAEGDSLPVKATHVEAFNIEHFLAEAAAAEQTDGEATLQLAVNYMARPNKDTTAVEWSTATTAFTLAK